MICDLPDVAGVVGETLRAIDISSGDHSEEPEERAIVIRGVKWDVLIFADGDLRQPVPGGVHGPPSNIADQGIPVCVACDLRIVWGAEPDARRRLDPVAPIVTRYEER